MLTNELMAVVNEDGNVDIKHVNGSKSPVKTMNCKGKGVVVTNLLQENGRVLEVYVQCNDGVVRVFSGGGTIIRTR